MKRFEIKHNENIGLSPYALVDTHTNEILVWCDTLRAAEFVKQDYNRLVEQDDYLNNYYTTHGLW